MKKAPGFETLATLDKVGSKRLDRSRFTEINLQAELAVMSGSLFSLAFESYIADALCEKKANVTRGVIFFFRALYRTIV